MKRSLWLRDTHSIGYVSDKKKADVIVIGAGLTGLAAAWRLCREGLDVLVLEAAGVGGGTSGHTTGKITSQHHLIYEYLIDQFSEEKAKMYADANQWAVKEYIDLISAEGIDCSLQEKPAYIYSHSDSAPLEREYMAAARLGLPCSMDTVSFSGNKVLAFHNQAQFHPRKFMLALADRIVEKGGTIIENSRVTHVEEKKICIATTDKGSYESDYIVYATLFPILDHTLFSMRLSPVLHHGIAFSVEKEEYEGMYIGADDISFRYHENTLIVVGQHRSMGDDKDAYQILERKALEKFHVGKELTRWSAHDLKSPDRVPFIGSYDPLTRKRFAATGFGAWGISHAMVAGKIISDKISGRKNPWETLYSPWRTGKVISAAIGKSKDAMKSMIKGKHMCSHMGCGLIYNEQDQTYDCPCHGSRFDKDGFVLWGPAVKGILEAKKSR